MTVMMKFGHSTIQDVSTTDITILITVEDTTDQVTETHSGATTEVILLDTVDTYLDTDDTDVERDHELFAVHSVLEHEDPDLFHLRDHDCRNHAVHKFHLLDPEAAEDFLNHSLDHQHELDSHEVQLGLEPLPEVLIEDLVEVLEVEVVERDLK